MTAERYLYIKNGDVVSQILEIGVPPEIHPEGGPNAFLSDFLSMLRDDRLFLIGCGATSREYAKATVLAKSYPCGSTTGYRAFRALLYVYATFLSLIKILHYKPTKVICGSAGPFLWLSFSVSRIYNIPIVHSRHNRVISLKSGFIRRLISSIDRKIIKRCDGVICHGPYLHAELQRIGLSYEDIIEFDTGFNDFYEQSKLSVMPQVLHDERHKRFVVFVGRIEKGKGVIDLYSAMKELFNEHQDIILVYAGDGGAVNRLDDIISGDENKSNVMLLGKLDRNELSALIKSAEIVVTPTRSEFPEGRCMAVMESLALGVPVIAPDFGPFPYLVQHEINGLLYQPDSISDLRHHLRRAIANNELLSSIQNGAKESSISLRMPHVRFSEAVSTAFNTPRLSGKKSRK